MAKIVGSLKESFIESYWFLTKAKINDSGKVYVSGNMYMKYLVVVE